MTALELYALVGAPLALGVVLLGLYAALRRSGYIEAGHDRS